MSGTVPVPEARRLRIHRGLSQVELARAVGVSRQALAAIESGRTRPSVDVALRLARALGTSVEALFSSRGGPERVVSAEMVGDPGDAPTPVRIADVRGRLLAYPVRRSAHVDVTLADGIAFAEEGERVRVRRFDDRARSPDLVVVGCDPAFALVAEILRRERGLDVLWVWASSRSALDALARGQAHVAGIHLRDPETGAYNRPWVERIVPGAATVIRFATWEQALLVARGNPLGIIGPSDLARDEVRFVNREAGSGTRLLADEWLREEGVEASSVPGYWTTCAAGHLDVAAAVSAGTADAGVAIRAAGVLFGLEVRTLTSEPYDLVLADHALDHPAVGALLDVLGATRVRRQVEALGGYDVEGMGRPA